MGLPLLPPSSFPGAPLLLVCPPPFNDDDAAKLATTSLGLRWRCASTGRRWEPEFLESEPEEASRDRAASVGGFAPVDSGVSQKM